MNKKELVVQAARQTGLSCEQADGVVNSVFAAIAEAVARGERVTIRDFGVFSAKDTAPRSVHHPVTGEAVSVPGYRVAAFRPAEKLKTKISDDQQ